MNIHVAEPRDVAGPPASRDARAVAALWPEPVVPRSPGWVRMAILLGGSLALWAGLGWVAFRILKLA